MKKHNLIFTLLLLLGCFQALGQVKVKGKVIDQNKETVIGATILEKGTKNGTITDINGNFSLSVASEKSSLVISFIGMKNETVALNGKSEIAVQLESSSVELQEVVAVGYGTMRKSDLTGSISSVKVKDAETTPVVSVDQLLKGKSSGVYVNSASAEPGGVSTVKIRGINSLSGDTEPLYVIDGVAMDNVGGGSNPFGGGNSQQKTNPLSYLSPQDILNVEILKDASATAIFGARGINGVILVTTKSGVAGATKVNFTSSLSVAQPRKKIEMLNGHDYARYRNELALLEGSTTLVYGMTEGTNPQNLKSVNWQDEVLQTSLSSSNRVSISGGSKSSNYYLSLGYDGNQGLVKNTAFNRGDVRFNFNSDISNKLKLNFNLSSALINTQMTQTTGAGGALNLSAIRSMISKNPIQNVITADDSELQASLNTPTAWVKDYKDDNSETNINAKLGLTYKISKVFSYEIRASYSSKISDRWRYYGRTLSSFAKGAAGYSAIKYSGMNIDNLLNFDYALNKANRISGVVGVTYSSNDNIGLSYQASEFDDDMLSYEQIGSASIIPVKLDRNRFGEKLNSYLARATYSLKDRYLLTLSGRVDGSSKFPVGNKFGFFPSAALAWRVKEETFLKEVDEISNLKLRLGWGQTGSKAAIPPFASSVIYTSFGYSSYPFGNTETTGKYIQTLGNTELMWETSEQTNVGLDIGLWNERVSLSVDLYSKINSDMLINRPLTPSFGYAYALVNYGTLDNKGIDLSANFVIVNHKSFKWSVDGNFSMYRNKILELNLVKDPITGYVKYDGAVVHPIGELNQAANIFIEGMPAGLFYGYQTAGVYQNQAEIDKFVSDVATSTGKPQNPAFYFNRKPTPGEVIYVDNNKDGKISTEDYAIIGNPNPDFTWGASSNMTYKNWGLTIAAVGVQGKDVLNANLNIENRLNGGLYNVRKDAYYGRWHGEGTSNYYGKPYSKTIASVISDRLVEDASFVRLSNITLSYTAKFKKTSFIKDLKVFATGNNLITLTKYSGFDPEVDSFVGDPMRIGIDNNSYPTSKSVILGFNLNF